jgi:hypothetical protein
LGTIQHCDAIVLGSSLGGWIAGTYLARAGLRVVLFEEDALAKRPPALREPFVATGLETGAPVQRVLRELALPLIEQRRLARDPVPIQVLLPHARVDTRVGRRELAAELADYGLCDAALAERWLELVDEAGADAARRVWETSRQAPSSPLLLRKLVERSPREAPLAAKLPSEPPRGLAPFVTALLGVLSYRPEGAGLEAPALLLHTLRAGGFLMPDASEPFNDLLRRRLGALHGEIRSLGAFEIVQDRHEIGLETPRGRVLARALVIAAPRELVARAIEQAGSTAPRWLRGAPPPAELPVRLFRAEREQVPVGLSARAVIARADGNVRYWLSRHADPDDARIEWLVAAGPEADLLPPENPLVDVNPFPGDGVVAVDPGPAAGWDRDASDLRFPTPRLESWLRPRPPVIAVGPEIEPGLGFEGEVLRAREAALRLVERLGGHLVMA